METVLQDKASASREHSRRRVFSESFHAEIKKGDVWINHCVFLFPALQQDAFRTS